jgi:hypothetical protein
VALLLCRFKPNLERVANDNSVIYLDDHELDVITATVWKNDCFDLNVKWPDFLVDINESCFVRDK